MRLGDEPTPELEATYYHSKSIELLIEALDKSPDTYDSILLTAVVIARLYEEFEVETDAECYHLTGAQKLLRHDIIARFALEGGLAEAASWVHLRQAIYVSITRRRPLDVSVQTFEKFTTHKEGTDSAYTSRIILLFAKTLQLLFPFGANDESLQDGRGQALRNQDDWESLTREIELWYQSRPASFWPIFCEDPERDRGKPFPVIDMISGIAG